MSALRMAVQARLQAGRPEQAWDEAAAALGSDRTRDWEHARLLLRWLAPRLPAAAWTDSRERTARKVGATPAPLTDRLGMVDFPAVDPGEDGRFITVTVRPVEGEDQLKAREELAPALDAARAFLGEPSLRFAVCFDHDDWRGDSAGLAVALAAVSAVRSLRISPLWVATGAIDAAGRVSPVGRIPQKLALRHAARPRALLLVPAVDLVEHPSVFGVRSLEEALNALVPGAREDLHEDLVRVRGLDRKGNWADAAREAATLAQHPSLTDEDRLELLLLRLMAANHSGDGALAAELSTRMEALTALVDPDDRLVLARVLAGRAVARVDALDPAGAARALGGDFAFQGEALVHLRGARALLATLEGRHADALALREENARVAKADERPRCLGDYADALLRLGRAEEALAAADEALDAARSVSRRRGYQQETTRFLELHRARALAALGRTDEALAALTTVYAAPGVDPRIRAALLAAELREDPAQVRALGEELPPFLRENPVFRALLDRSLARLGDPEALARLLALPPFRGLSVDEAARRLPY